MTERKVTETLIYSAPKAPWAELKRTVAPFYPSSGGRCRPPIGLSRGAAPDATALLRFRRLLETHQLTESIFNTINAHLAEKCLLLREGTIVDATLM